MQYSSRLFDIIYHEQDFTQLNKSKFRKKENSLENVFQLV